MSTQFPLTIIAKDCFGQNQVLEEDAYKEYSSEKAALRVIDRFCTDKSITNGLKVIGEAEQYLGQHRTKPIFPNPPTSDIISIWINR